MMRNEMNLNDAVKMIADWATERGIYEHSTPHAQLMKAMSELGELADAEIKDSHADKVDAIGDVFVCLVNYAEMSDINFNSAVASAYNEIKDRKGRMVPGGAFVKDDDNDEEEGTPVEGWGVVKLDNGDFEIVKAHHHSS